MSKLKEVKGIHYLSAVSAVTFASILTMHVVQDSLENHIGKLVTKDSITVSNYGPTIYKNKIKTNGFSEEFISILNKSQTSKEMLSKLSSYIKSSKKNKENKIFTDEFSVSFVQNS